MFRVTRPVAAVTAALATAGLTHCSSDDPPGGAAGAAGRSDDVSCADDSRVDTYTAKLRKSGLGGALSFELTSSEPAPPAKGTNRFEVRVTGADGEALEGDLGIELEMPDHGHGSTVTPGVSFDAESGLYTVEPVQLFMPGIWRVGLDFVVGDTELDRTEFFFCIEG
jgi:hypothetical protein